MLDADIYGPSMPRLLGIPGRPQTVDGKILKPMENYGLKVMSMGFLVDEETPMIWRGPMVMSALTQMLREVEWGELDVLVVDMPPGTGDAQLTMAQQVPLAGAVIVSTPQDLALIDARKGLNMFRKVDVPLLGIVENMSYFIAPDTGKRYDIFGHGGARREAERLGVAFLGEVPLRDGDPRDSDERHAGRRLRPDGAGGQDLSRHRRQGLGPPRRGARRRPKPRRRSCSNRRSRPAHLRVEPREELAGELLRGRGDQPAAELRDLAADIGLRCIFEEGRVGPVLGQRRRRRRPWRSRRCRPCLRLRSCRSAAG